MTTKLEPIQRELLTLLLVEFIEKNSTNTFVNPMQPSVRQCQVCGQYRGLHRAECPVGVAEGIRDELEDEP